MSSSSVYVLHTVLRIFIYFNSTKMILDELISDVLMMRFRDASLIAYMRAESTYVAAVVVNQLYYIDIAHASTIEIWELFLEFRPHTAT